jgi:glucosamine kinase
MAACLARGTGVTSQILLLGVDGGGTNCRARLTAASGEVLGEAATGPANLRLGLKQGFSAAVDAAALCLAQAALSRDNLSRIVACLAMAGASEPSYLAAAQAYRHPFRTVVITTDAHAACVGAHGERDGAIIIAGTGTVGWAVLKGQPYRIGGWGLPASDEGSGAWIGIEALRRVLWAHDGRRSWTPLLRALYGAFDEDAHALAGWTHEASPGDFGSLAPRVVEYAQRGDAVAEELMTSAAFHIDTLAKRLREAGAPRLCLVGGLAPFLESRLSEETRLHLTPPAGDALQGALHLARRAAHSPARVA